MRLLWGYDVELSGIEWHNDAQIPNFTKTETKDPNVRVVSALAATSGSDGGGRLIIDYNQINAGVVATLTFGGRSANAVALYNLYSEGVSGVVSAEYDVDLIETTGAGTLVTAANISEPASGQYELAWTSHGLSVGELCRLNVDSGMYLGRFPDSNWGSVLSVPSGNAVRFADTPSLSTGSNVRVYKPSDLTVTNVAVDQAVSGQQFVDVRDTSLETLNYAIHYNGSVVDYDALVITFHIPSGTDEAVNLGRIKIGEYFEPRLEPTPPFSMPYVNKSPWYRLWDGAIVSDTRTRHRNARINLLIDDVETGGVSELSRINDMLRDIGVDNDIFIDMEPGQTTTRAKDTRMLGRVVQTTGPVDNGEYINGGRAYRFSMEVEESV